MSASALSDSALESHDTEIISINMDRKNSVCRLDLSLTGENLNSLELFGLIALRIEDFGLQNILSRILRSATKDFSEDDLNYWLEWVTSLSDTSSWLKPERKIEWIEAINAGKFELVVLEPSVGAQIAGVCERVRRL